MMTEMNLEFNHDSNTFFYDDSVEDFESNESLLKEMRNKYSNAEIGHVIFYKKHNFLITNASNPTELGSMYMHNAIAELESARKKNNTIDKLPLHIRIINAIRRFFH